MESQDLKGYDKTAKRTHNKSVIAHCNTPGLTCTKTLIELSATA